MKRQPFGGAFAPSLCGSEAVRSLQEELVAAIQGALEVAMELAVQEVRALVGQATSDMYEELRRENESLREKLQRAERMLDCVHMKDNVSGARQRDEALHPTSCGQWHTMASFARTEIGNEAAGHGCLGPDLRGVSRHEELRSDRDMTQSDSEAENKDEAVTEIMSQCIALKTEGMISPCQNQQAPESAKPISTVKIKQEELDEENRGAPCSLDFIKKENLSLEGIKWSPEMTDIQSQDPKDHVLGEKVDQAPPPAMSSSLPPPSDPESISSEFPNSFHLAQQASVSQAPPQVHGSHVETARSVSIPTCKFCGQTFPVPSLLRRHYGQGRQRLLQCCQPPIAGGARTRRQLYPPGCSPFRCTVCSREFNRLENLKTHLRIHTGERPYTCSVCLKCFRHSGALTRHFRIHTGEKPYVCGQCGKSFRHCGGLKFHQRSHNKHLE
ncbi:zinc finger protein 70 [Girardinichthys multiradiatus]|uniref:zinc finger protein 70 n=1 Tax=Girardinichthys multiradiatus TaxID=208333 RepID=UPI001FAE24DA|nr:zinc finger protein 70 [Girardinichthys multiradiatus]